MKTKQAEFLELLANPVRVQIREDIELFRGRLKYLSSYILSVITWERSGCHDIIVVVRDPNFFSNVRQVLSGTFPSSSDYTLRKTNTSTIYTAPDGDVAYEQRYSIVES